MGDGRYIFVADVSSAEVRMSVRAKVLGSLLVVCKLIGGLVSAELECRVLNATSVFLSWVKD